MKIIITESALVRIVIRIINEQTPLPLLGVGDAVKVGGRSFDLAKPGAGRVTSSRTPNVEDGIDPDLSLCEYTSEEKIKHFFDEAKTWKGSVDEKYMNSIIEKLKTELDSYWTGRPSEILRLLGQIKTKPGMGYLIRTFKLNNKDLFNTLSSDYRFPWVSVVQTLKDNFQLPYGPSGCGGQL